MAPISLTSKIQSFRLVSISSDVVNCKEKCRPYRSQTVRVKSSLMGLLLCELLCAWADRWQVASVPGDPDDVLRGVGCGAQVYLLCPHHAARWLQWLQWWLRGEEGSRLLLIKPCKCKTQPSSENSSSCKARWDIYCTFTGNATGLRGVPHALLQRELVLIENSVRIDPYKERGTEILRWRQR